MKFLYCNFQSDVILERRTDNRPVCHACIMWFLLFVLLINNRLSKALIYKNLCSSDKPPVQCQALMETSNIPSNEECDPLEKKDCKMNDFVSNEIAACQLDVPKEDPDYYYARCRPLIKKSPNLLYQVRNVGASTGHPSCMPVRYGMKMQCGEKGTRCVCDTGRSSIKHQYMLDVEEFHNCRCQWFIDFCGIPNICSSESKGCERTNNGAISCPGGSLNHCLANPKLCEDTKGYCIELSESNHEWIVGGETVGNGFACFKKEIYDNMAVSAPYCDFDQTDHILVGKESRRPGNNLDYCCYRHLICVRRKEKLGGYFFKKRPCYCNFELKKCLQKLQSNARVGLYAQEMLSVINHVKECSMDDSGLCDPFKPVECNKGDLIDPSIATCKVNCKSGPLLPIELRSCRIRKCVPPNNRPNVRIIDVTDHRESSRCDPVKGLPLECGLHHTRCVCDGNPTVPYFTDGCRCQFWPD